MSPGPLGSGATGLGFTVLLHNSRASEGLRRVSERTLEAWSAYLWQGIAAGVCNLGVANAKAVP